MWAERSCRQRQWKSDLLEPVHLDRETNKVSIGIRLSENFGAACKQEYQARHYENAAESQADHLSHLHDRYCR